MGQTHRPEDGSARCIALVGPYLSGKTSLLEAILERTGVVSRQGTVAEKNTLGDNSPEARLHAMSVEMNVAEVDYLGDRFTFIDCPGSLEFGMDAAMSLPAVDLAVVVCEPDEKKTPALQLILKQLEDQNIPHLLFLNKIDRTDLHVRDIIPMLQPASQRPMVLRQIPIWKNDIVIGFVDLALERAYLYREHAPSEVIELPGEIQAREEEARFEMLEKLADYDDELMTQLLEDVAPPRDKVFDDLVAEMRAGDICPVVLGSAEQGHGVTRLLKLLRHEAPSVRQTRARLGLADKPAAYVLKTFHTDHGGKLSLVRVLGGEFVDGEQIESSNGAHERISGLFTVLGHEPKKRQGPAKAGDTLAFGRLEAIKTGETVAKAGDKPQTIVVMEPLTPVYGLAILAKARKDDVRLTAAIQKLIDEDSSLSLEHNQDLGQMILWGQGEIHLRVAIERLASKFAIEVDSKAPAVPYKESIVGSVEIRGRHKKQSGGHGQFGDVVVEIRPLPRGTGFEFSESISGGVVPRQYFPAVENGVRDYLGAGPLGFPVVDVAVELKDGSYHTVDSSEQAFRMAGTLAMKEGMPQCKPVLLEPVMAVSISVPSEATARINGIISGRRGQILGFDARPGWPGWDVVEAHMPQAELQRLIIDLRSATAGVGTFTSRFDHLAEVNGKLREQILAEHAA